ncbi:MAG: phosphatidylserine decarboxylase [Syntrophobacterales bacterium]|nr:phosphatidylserine decarboxylase [Syntrophobacterales bacterium]
MSWAWLSLPAALAAGYLYWRHVWFFRNPPRTPPSGENIVSPADGRVVYARVVAAHEEVILLKQGRALALSDILRFQVSLPRVHVGIFMAPWDVHYNRAPLAGTVTALLHFPPHRGNVHMTPMQWRTLLKRPPLYRGARHLLYNERLVTTLRGTFLGEEVDCQVIQIAGGSVRGIDSFTQVGARLEKGDIFGMIRIGSQVDVVLPWHPAMELRVQPGQRVRAGESILIAPAAGKESDS